MPCSRTITASSLIAGTYAPPAVHDPRTAASCGMPCLRHRGLVEEDPAEVLAVGEHLVLQRQERPAGVDEVQAGQPVLQRHLLRAQVLLHRHRVVRAALDGGVVGDDDALAAGDPPDAGDDPRAGGVAVVHAVRGQRRQLQEAAARVQQGVHPLARQQLAALDVPGAGPLAAAQRHPGQLLAQVAGQRAVRRGVAGGGLGVGRCGAAQHGGVHGADVNDGSRRRSTAVNILAVTGSDTQADTALHATPRAPPGGSRSCARRPSCSPSAAPGRSASTTSAQRSA